MSRNVKKQQKKIFNLLWDLVPDDMKEKKQVKNLDIYFSEKTYEIVASSDYISNKKNLKMRWVWLSMVLIHIYVPKILKNLLYMISQSI